MTGGGKTFLADAAGPLLGWSNPAFSCGPLAPGIGGYAPIQIAAGETPPQFVDLSQNPDEARSMHDLLFPKIRGASPSLLRFSRSLPPSILDAGLRQSQVAPDLDFSIFAAPADSSDGSRAISPPPSANGDAEDVESMGGVEDLEETRADPKELLANITEEVWRLRTNA